MKIDKFIELEIFFLLFSEFFFQSNALEKYFSNKLILWVKFKSRTVWTESVLSLERLGLE